VAAVSAVRNYLSNALGKPGTRTRIHAIRVATNAGCLVSAVPVASG